MPVNGKLPSKYSRAKFAHQCRNLFIHWLEKIRPQKNSEELTSRVFRPASIASLRRLKRSTSNLYLVIPLLAILLFAAAMAVILWSLHTREAQQQQDSLYRDVAWAQQKIRLNLLSNQDLILSLSRDMAASQLSQASYKAAAQEIMRENSEIYFIDWIDSGKNTRWVLPASSPLAISLHSGESAKLAPEIAHTFDAIKATQRSAYSTTVRDADGKYFIYFGVPIVREGEFLGVLGTLYAIDGILNNLLPIELADQYKFSITDIDGSTLSSQESKQKHTTALHYEVILDPLSQNLSLRAEAYPRRSNLANNMLLWLVIGLSCFMMWSLWSLWRHTRRRFEAQQALLLETNFRRAMENSMAVGMRALDLDGRISYVNPAFCKMTGWESSDLVGLMPPFPYWPSKDYAELQRNIDNTLAGTAPESGFEMRVMRKNGTVFFARMYVSPLVNERGEQTGWMSSLTDITEPKQAREELAASHERFTTVLESLDAAVSVWAPDKADLLFANRYYKQIFGSGTEGHLVLSDGEFDVLKLSDDALDYVDGFAGLPAAELTPHSADSREIFLSDKQKWFEVRRRYIQWVDGRLAQIIIATDITERKAAEALARQHEEKLQFASRLTTMGEMASSLAHELNQPLAAINNYCMGAVALLKSGRSTPEGILPALEKTSAQAVRAGTIIQRIRGFVKRSQPQRREADVHEIIADAVGLAEIETTRRRIRIHTDVPLHLPKIYVDPILIEQVIMNLLKNAAEAMHNHQPNRLGGVVKLSARVYLNAAGENIAIDVSDQGPGVDEDLKERLFEPFFSTKEDGMGMGLNICRSIIESHQGRLWVENNASQVGCTFKILLPIKPVLSEH